MDVTFLELEKFKCDYEINEILYVRAASHSSQCRKFGHWIFGEDGGAM